jgi:hypothetical protein
MFAIFTSHENAALKYNTHAGLITASLGLNTRAVMPRSKSVCYIASATLLYYALQPRNFSYFLTQIHHMLRFSQYPLSILIFYISPSHLSIKFPPLKLSTQQCPTDIKITGTEIKKSV